MRTAGYTISASQLVSHKQAFVSAPTLQCKLVCFCAEISFEMSSVLCKFGTSHCTAVSTVQLKKGRKSATCGNQQSNMHTVVRGMHCRNATSHRMYYRAAITLSTLRASFVYDSRASML